MKGHDGAANVTWVANAFHEFFGHIKEVAEMLNLISSKASYDQF